MGPSKVLTTLLFQVQCYRKLLLWELSFLLCLCFSWGPQPSNTVTSSSSSQHCDFFFMSSCRYIFTPLFNLPFFLPTPPLSTNNHHLSGHFVTLLPAPFPPFVTLVFPAIFLCHLLPLSPLAHSRFFNAMPQIFKPEALNFSTLSRSILQTLSIFRNSTSMHLLFSGCQNTLPCDVIALIPGLHSFS